MSVSGAEGRLALALLCALAAATAHAHAHALHTRAESESAIVSPAPFTFAARYGRSPPERLITPRNDRWMMSTRYGKRAEWSPPAPAAGGAPLYCEYTGVLTLYHCARTHRARRALPPQQ